LLMFSGVPRRERWGDVRSFPREGLGQHSWNLSTATGWNKRNWNWFHNTRNTRCKFYLYELATDYII